MKLHFSLGVMATLLLGACASAGAEPLSGKTVLVPGNALYSGAVGHGDTIYLAGVIGLSEGGDVQEATRQAMDTVRERLTAAGGEMGDLLKCTVFMTDIEQYGPMNEVYATYFESDPPARTAIAVSALPMGAMVEVECIAAR